MQRFRNTLLLCFIPLLGMTFFSCHAQKKAIKSNGKKVAVVDTIQSENNKKRELIPDIDFITAQRKEMTTADLVKGQPVLMVLFNPSCGHCQKLLEQIRDNISLFKNINIVFLTGKPLKEVLPNYVVNVKVDKMKEIMVVSDKEDITIKIFEYFGIPQIMLYNKEHKLEFMYYKDATNKQMLSHLRK